MTDVLQFAILGLGIGAIYALLAQGLILIHRGSGVINLAQGHLALGSAYLLIELRRDMPTILALPLVLILMACVGLLVHVLVMRPLRTASPIVRIIATLGVLTIVAELCSLRFGAEQQSTDPVLPTGSITISSVVVGQQTLALTLIALAVTVALTAATQRSRLGLALTAAAENPRAASALGWSPDYLAILTWSLGGALAGLAGTLVPSATGGFFNLTSLGLLIVGALAAALVASFRSYPLAMAAGLGIGVIQSEATKYVHITGIGDAVPFVLVLGFLMAKGTALPVRGTLTDRLPTVGTGRLRLIPVALISAAAVWWLQTQWTLEYDYLQAVVISASLAVVALSIVVLTGYTGQLSLAQMGLAGLGAWVAGRLVAGHGWTFGQGVVAGVAVAALAGVAFGVPALRVRGVNLTVLTFGLGFALYAVVFSSTAPTGGSKQTQIPAQHLFGLAIDPLLNLDNYASICVIAFALCGVLVANLRRSRTGRSLLAVRQNERAAAALGINVFAAKLYAFGLASAVAGLGGILLAFSYGTILYPQLFGPFSSVTVLTIAVVGGLGYVTGPFWGSFLAAGGLGVVLASESLGGAERYVGLAGGVLLIVVLLVSQNGLAPATTKLVPGALRRLRLPGLTPKAARDQGTTRLAKPQILEVAGIRQQFGGVKALDDVTLALRPGQVLGLLGPNGAGKTTLIDVITGHVQMTAGRVSLGEHDISRWSAARRSRAGVVRTFQALELFDDLTVSENLLAAADRRSWWTYLSDLVWPGKGLLDESVRQVAEELGLADVLDKTPTELSYGERRRVSIARAIAASPSVLLLDEPGAGLDQRETAELGDLVRRLAEDRQMAILLIEHDVDMVVGTSDEVLVLDFGRPIFHGEPADVSSDPGVRSAYLGGETAVSDDRIITPN